MPIEKEDLEAFAKTLLQSVNDKVHAAITEREKRSAGSVEEQVAKHVADLKAKADEAAKAEDAKKAAAADGGASDKITLKSLQEQIAKQQESFAAQLAASNKARQDAEQKARETRMRADVQSMFGARVGADNPHIKANLAAMFDIDKRFVPLDDGSTGIKFKREGGYEETMPLDKGFDELLSGELKHVVPAKAGNLPPTGFRGIPGQPYRAPQPGQQAQPGLMGIVATQLGTTSPDAGNALMAHALATPPK